MAVHRFLNPSTIAAPRGYSHVVETKGPSRTIYLSGQLGMTADGKFAGAPGDFRAQAVQAFENLKLALAAAGADFEHVVKVTAYFTDITDIATYLDVRNRYVNTAASPPRRWRTRLPAITSASSRCCLRSMWWPAAYRLPARCAACRSSTRCCWRSGR